MWLATKFLKNWPQLTSGDQGEALRPTALEPRHPANGAPRWHVNSWIWSPANCYHLLFLIYKNDNVIWSTWEYLHTKGNDFLSFSSNLGLMDYHLPLSEDLRGFPGGPVVKTSPSNAGGMGSIPGRRAKIPHVSWPKNQNMVDSCLCMAKTIKIL